MSDQNQPAPQAPATTAAAPNPAPAPAAQPPATAQTATAENVSMSSEQLKQRLEQERQRAEASFLKRYGVDSADALKAIVDSGKQAADEKKTELERLSAQLEEAKKGSARAIELESLVGELTSQELGRLPEKVRETILAKHPDNPQAQVALIKVMRDAGLLDAASAGTSGTTTTSAAPAPAAPANNGAASPAPTAQQAQTAFQKYEALQKSNPTLAAIFFQANRSAVDSSRPATQQ